MEFPLLQDMLIFLGFSVVIVFILQRLKLPSILGFLLTGIIIGPFGLALVAAEEQIAFISEIGIILLLFVIGMELSIKQLISIKKTVFLGGGMQVFLTILITAGTYFLIGSSLSEAVFVGFLFSLSSTAIVLSILPDRNEINTQHGKNVLAILIFQDLIVVPMMLFTPIIAGASTNVTESILMLLLKSAVVIIIMVISAKYLVPKIMFAIAKTRSKELFLLATITICFAVAFLTAQAGLSLAFGAFLAGLIISESQYSYQATSIILPFRELFTSFFFISIGMMLDLDAIATRPFFVIGMAIAFWGLAGLAVGLALGDGRAGVSRRRDRRRVPTDRSRQRLPRDITRTWSVAAHPRGSFLIDVDGRREADEWQLQPQRERLPTIQLRGYDKKSGPRRNARPSALIER